MKKKALTNRIRMKTRKKNEGIEENDKNTEKEEKKKENERRKEESKYKNDEEGKEKKEFTATGQIDFSGCKEDQETGK